MAGYLEAARTAEAVYIRVVGLGNFNNAGPMREYCEKAFSEDVPAVIVDLRDCTGLDSTFMGTLMGFLDFKVKESPVTVSVVNATPPTMRAMNSLGLPKILHVKTEPVKAPEGILMRLQEGWQDRHRRTRLIRDAHVALVKADKENEQRFGPFVEALIKEARELMDEQEDNLK
jgi:anti-sigma B factor antagonist